MPELGPYGSERGRGAIFVPTAIRAVYVSDRAISSRSRPATSARLGEKLRRHPLFDPGLQCQVLLRSFTDGR